jgi:hypothetical protein
MARSIYGRRWVFVALLVAAGFVLLPGCGARSATGTVSFDGTPVDGGVISFVPEGKAARANADIVGGKYTVASGTLTTGKNRVEILWNKKTGRKIPVPGDPGTTTDETLQVIPEKFNKSSTLTADVKSGNNTIDFDLKSK